MMKFRTLKDFIRHHQDNILGVMSRRLGQLPWSPYQEFILKSDEGQSRLRAWVQLLIGALEGQEEAFFKDQEIVGYQRAAAGFASEFSYQIYLHFQNAIWELIGEEARKKRIDIFELWWEIQNLHEVMLKGESIIAASFQRPREELVREKVTYLEEIYEYSKSIIKVLDLEEIVRVTLGKTKNLFRVDVSLLLVRQNGRTEWMHTYSDTTLSHRLRETLEETLHEEVPFFVHMGGDVHRDIHEDGLKLIVTVPIHAHGNSYGALALSNGKIGFEFMQKELELLNQLLHMTAVAVENALMLKEIDQHRRELRFLANKMISIQEEERTRLAADIHDTVSQTLTAIGYKAEVCKEILRRRPQSLSEHLDDLTKRVNEALYQSKELIRQLRPDLIDTMGLVPALKRHISVFMQETGIRVKSRLPKRLDASSEVSITLFRIAQESLMNVYKHARAESAEVSLKRGDGHVALVVTDSGKGFDVRQGDPLTMNGGRFGLLSMKQRVESVGGTLKIDAVAAQGCRVEARIPIKRDKSCPPNSR
jgi:signal transduction histidine kinase